MNKQEFQERIRQEIPQTDYDVVEFVYTHHPIIDEVKGKDQIAAIYKLPGGMRIIRDMVHTAEVAKELRDQLIVVNCRILELKREKEELYAQMRGLLL